LEKIINTNIRSNSITNYLVIINFRNGKKVRTISVENIIINKCMNQLKSLDLVELDRVLEDIAKTYAAPAATVWFKITDNRKPTKEEYNKKSSNL
jgi:hypothetical protein